MFDVRTVQTSFKVIIAADKKKDGLTLTHQ